MKLTDALAGFMIHAESRRLSENTLADYFNTYGKLVKFIGGNTPVEEITKEQIMLFLGSFKGMSKKTLSNYHIGLSALWTWMVEDGIVHDHVVRQIKRARPERRVIEPFSEMEMRMILSSLEKSARYSTHGGTVTSHSLANRLRNRMIILVMLTTGMRASELCGIKLKDVDLTNKRIRIMGKGSLERFVPITDGQTRKAIWTYLQTRKDKLDTDALVVSAQGLPITRRALNSLLKTLEKRSGVPNCHPHRFRHTFAIEFLRNHGNIFTLQQILGHSDLTTCKIYLNLAARDVQRDHAMASPVANWNL